MKLFIVFYEIIGSRCNGTYLVHTSTKNQACRIVGDLDDDYICRSGAEEIGTYTKLSKLTQDELDSDELNQHCLTVEDIKSVKKVGSSYQLECGT